MTHFEKSIDVNVPVSTAYNQWTQFQEFPRFMAGVQEVKQLDDRRLHWRAAIGGVTKEWEAEITEQRPDERIAWQNTSGAKNAGVVSFAPLDRHSTRVTLGLDYDPEGFLESIGDALGFVTRQVDGDLQRFKEFIESRGIETGAWRGKMDSANSTNTGAATSLDGTDDLRIPARIMAAAAAMPGSMAGAADAGALYAGGLGAAALGSAVAGERSTGTEGTDRSNERTGPSGNSGFDPTWTGTSMPDGQQPESSPDRGLSGETQDDLENVQTHDLRKGTAESPALHQQEMAAAGDDSGTEDFHPSGLNVGEQDQVNQQASQSTPATTDEPSA